MIDYLQAGNAAQVTHLLLHGIGSHAGSWQFQLKAAQGRSDLRVLAWNAPGYLNSTHLQADAPTSKDYALALWTWLDELKVTTPIVLVGHSLGCLIAAAAAAMQPARVRDLLLLSPARGYGAATQEERAAKLHNRLATLRELGIAGMAKTRSAALLSPLAPQALLDKACSLMSQLNERGYTQAAQMLANGDITADLGQLTCPVRVAVGSLDAITPPATCAQVAQEAKTALVDLGAVGHLCALEAPQVVSDLIGGAGPAFASLQPWPSPSNHITVGDLCAEFLAHIGVRAAFGVISIHNMPILDGFHTRGRIRFVSARGEAGACNMADAYARVNQHLGVVVTSTGTGAGNAAGALIEALTAGTPLLHLTGQIESPYLDLNLGFIHEAQDQLGMLRAVGKAAYRISNPEEALDILQQAVTLAFTPPCGPVSIEIAIDVQKMRLNRPAALQATSGLTLQSLLPRDQAPQGLQLDALVEVFKSSKRPLLWLGGGARQAGAAVERFIKLGFGIVTSVQGRGVVPENHPQSMGAFNLQKAAQDLYAASDAMLVVGSRLRSNETLTYQLRLPQNLYRVDANPKAIEAHPYAVQQFICADATLTLNALADKLEGKSNIDATWTAHIQAARQAAQAQVDTGLAAYVALKNAVANLFQSQSQSQSQPQPVRSELVEDPPSSALRQAQGERDALPIWVRDITLSNTMWGNRSVNLSKPWQGVHALGGGIGQGLQMAIGSSLAGIGLDNKKVIALVGDGGLMLNVGELACAVQERARVLLIVMNDQRYGVIKNIQDADYGSRHAYVELHTPNFALLCKSVGAGHHLLDTPTKSQAILDKAWREVEAGNVVMVEVAMQAWGEFAVKFAGPPRKV
ncbi:MAG: thiamine pyrophosphate-binding protein [Cytophagales bacterium]|nr:thiamine pyrophosphate-binding protein [Cytophagales bacterium]